MVSKLPILLETSHYSCIIFSSEIFSFEYFLNLIAIIMSTIYHLSIRIWRKYYNYNIVAIISHVGSRQLLRGWPCQISQYFQTPITHSPLLLTCSLFSYSILIEVRLLNMALNLQNIFKFSP